MQEILLPHVRGWLYPAFSVLLMGPLTPDKHAADRGCFGLNDLRSIVATPLCSLLTFRSGLSPNTSIFGAFTSTSELNSHIYSLSCGIFMSKLQSDRRLLSYLQCIQDQSDGYFTTPECSVSGARASLFWFWIIARSRLGMRRLGYEIIAFSLR
jgi:hypothetical protein